MLSPRWKQAGWPRQASAVTQAYARLHSAVSPLLVAPPGLPVDDSGRQYQLRGPPPG